MRMGKYEMGRTLGEGHFGKVRLARHADTGRAFAIKILDRQRILAMKINEQVRTPPFRPINRSIDWLIDSLPYFRRLSLLR
jgi:serine/threonine protein kinase